jgi:hypothetical protein
MVRGMADSKGKCLTLLIPPIPDEILYEFPEHPITIEFFYFDKTVHPSCAIFF